MEKRDSFDQMANGISDEERQNILDQLRPSETYTNAPFKPVDEELENDTEPLEIKIKKEPFLLRFFIWLKSVLSNTTQSAIYNEYKLSLISHYVTKNFFSRHSTTGLASLRPVPIFLSHISLQSMTLTALSMYI